MKKIYKYLTALAVILVSAIVFYSKVYIPKSTYKTISPTVGNLDVKVFGVGNLGAKSIYNITAGVMAKVLSIKVDEGQWVKKGQLLAVLDAVDLPIQLQESKISVQKAISELKASQKELESLNVQKNLAFITFKRYDKLKQQSFASQAEYDKAKADLDSIRAQIEATKAHISSAKTEVQRVKKSVEALKEKLSRYMIYAPSDGYVISKNVEIAQTVLASEALLKIVNPKDVWVKAYVDEKISAEIKVSDIADIRLRSQSDKTYKGYVKRIVAQSDPITQEREVDISFENLPIPFYINEQAEVAIHTKQLKNIVKIPSYAVVYKDKKSGIWINENGKAHFQECKIVAIADSEIAVKDINTDAKILIESEHKKPLREGTRVH